MNRLGLEMLCNRLHYIGARFGHDHTTGDIVSRYGQIFIVTAPDGGDHIRRKANKPDVFASISSACFSSYRTIS